MENRSKHRNGLKSPAAEVKAPANTQQPAMDGDNRDYSIPAIQYHDVTAAAYRIRKGVKETPLEVSSIV